jgi:hypothetical protein
MYSKVSRKETPKKPDQRLCFARFSQGALTLLAFGLLPVPGLSVAADIVQPTQCILDQPHAPFTMLNCSAKDI